MAIAFVFPGQGSQKVGMCRALAEAFPESRQVFESADAAVGFPLSGMCFEGPEDALTLTTNTQPAILAASVAAYRALAARGARADWVAGHSLGEWSALVAAGTVDLGEAVRAVRKRGQFMQEAVPVGEGAMAAILGLDGPAVSAACDQARSERAGRVVSPANLNAPGQVVIAGHADAVARAGEIAKAGGAKRVIPLPVSAPFHCALMRPAEDRLAPLLRGLAVQDPQFPIVANVDALPKRLGAEAVEALIRQVSSPVRWEDVVTRLIAEGVQTFVELGPGTVLAGLIKKIDRRVSVISVGAPGDLDALEAVQGASP